ncbi:MAG: hypothetical protein OXG27_13230 [Chloroflexi bacterium]|nr:hypothetical protein [Chloroflexota bacterium]
MENVNHTARTRGRYVGPSAARIAELIAPRQRVRFERGWFWTAAVCHDSEQDQLSFRQRPDGDGIDVRCKSAGCSRERVIRSLEQLTGESIWSAYTTEPRPSTPLNAPAERTDGTGAAERTGGRSRGLALAPFVVLLVAAPLAFGYDIQLALLNAVGLNWTAWLGRRVLLNRRRAAAKEARSR